VSTAAPLAAMELIGGMSDNPAAAPGDQLLDDIQQAQLRPAELTQAFATLLDGFLQVVNHADLDMIVGSVTRRLWRLELVPEVMVTRMHGALRAPWRPSSRRWVGASSSARSRLPRRSPGRAAAGCWLICSRTSAERAGSARGAATGSCSCW
jgi:hypothetical protein